MKFLKNLCKYQRVVNIPRAVINYVTYAMTKVLKNCVPVLSQKRIAFWLNLDSLGAAR